MCLDPCSLHSYYNIHKMRSANSQIASNKLTVVAAHLLIGRALRIFLAARLTTVSLDIHNCFSVYKRLHACVKIGDIGNS